MPSPPDDFERRLDALYKLGTELQSKIAKSAPVFGDKFIDKEFERKRRPGGPDRLRKAKTLADPVKGFSPKELADLKRKVREAAEKIAAKHAGAAATKTRKYAAPKLRFGVAHVIRLLPAPKAGGIRSWLLDSCLKEGWNVSKLEVEVRRATEASRGKGGRRPKFGPGERDLAAYLEEMCDRWTRLSEQMKGQKGPDTLDELHGEVTTAFDEVIRAVAELRKKLSGRRRKERKTTTKANEG